MCANIFALMGVCLIDNGGIDAGLGHKSAKDCKPLRYLCFHIADSIGFIYFFRFKCPVWGIYHLAGDLSDHKNTNFLLSGYFSAVFRAFVKKFFCADVVYVAKSA